MESRTCNIYQFFRSTEAKFKSFVSVANDLAETFANELNCTYKAVWDQEYKLSLEKERYDRIYPMLQKFATTLKNEKQRTELQKIIDFKPNSIRNPPPPYIFAPEPICISIENFGFRSQPRQARGKRKGAAFSPNKTTRLQVESNLREQAPKSSETMCTNTEQIRANISNVECSSENSRVTTNDLLTIGNTPETSSVTSCQSPNSPIVMSNVATTGASLDFCSLSDLLPNEIPCLPEELYATIDGVSPTDILGTAFCSAMEQDFEQTRCESLTNNDMGGTPEETNAPNTAPGDEHGVSNTDQSLLIVTSDDCQTECSVQRTAYKDINRCTIPSDLEFNPYDGINENH